VASTSIETRWGRHDLSLLGGLILGVGSGFRPDLLVLIGPLWLFGAWRRGIRGIGLGVVLADWLVNIASTMVVGRNGERLLYTLRVKIFAQLQRLGLDFYEREMSGRIMTSMTSDLDALSIGAEVAAPIGAHSNIAKLAALTYGKVINQLDMPYQGNPDAHGAHE